MALSYRINAVFVWKPVRLVLEFLECAIRTGITINTRTFYANVLSSSCKKPSQEKRFAGELEQQPVVNAWIMLKTRGHAELKGARSVWFPIEDGYDSLLRQKIWECGSPNVTLLFLFDHDLKSEGEKEVWKVTYRATQSVRVTVKTLRLHPFLQSRTMLRRNLEHGLVGRVITYSINWILVCEEFISSNNISSQQYSIA